MDKIDWNKPLEIRVGNIWQDLNVERIRNKPEPRYIWLNIYSTGSLCEPCAIHYHKPCRSQHSKGYIHTLKVNVDTGETEKVSL